jgi:hypothetical protein
MSNQILNTLFDAHAFDGSPLHVDMPAYHIPFDDRGRTGVESGVVRAAHSSERLGVQGPIGCGKTSLLRYALDSPDGTVAPIWLFRLGPQPLHGSPARTHPDGGSRPFKPTHAPSCHAPKLWKAPAGVADHRSCRLVPASFASRPPQPT